MSNEFHEFNEQSISGLLGSRICHDLIGPLGAIGNGVELLTMGFGEVDSGETPPELELINESVSSALNRIRLFRIAFGEALPGQELQENDIKAALNGFLESQRLSVVWYPEGSQSRLDIKMVFLAMMCLDSALPKGGELRVETIDRAWKVTSTAPRIMRDKTLWDGLSSGKTDTDFAPQNVHFAMLALILKATGRRLAEKHHETEQSLRF